MREMVGLLEGLKSFKHRLTNERVVYITDSQSCDLICRKGSGKMNLQSIAKDIDFFVRQNNIEFSTAWIKRELNMEADELSKIKDPDDWAISMQLFNKIQVLSGFNFTLDPFAAAHNKKCKKFYSKYMCPDSSGINGLAFSWHGEVCWVCPPPSLSLKVLVHFRSSRAKGVMLFPDWGSLPLIPLLEFREFKDHIKNVWSFPGSLFLEVPAGGNFNVQLFKAIKVVVCDFSNIVCD